MKPATGNNPSAAAQHKVSIQLKLGGHSFSADTLGAIPDDAAVEASVGTQRCVLVPKELFSTAAMEAILAGNGTPCGEDETPVHSDPSAGIVAVMAVATATLEQLLERFGDRIAFTTPLLMAPDSEAPTVRLHAEDTLLYIAVFRKGLQFAEIFPLRTADDELCLLQRIGQQFGETAFRIVVSGERCRKRRKVFARYYKQVTECES